MNVNHFDTFLRFVFLDLKITPVIVMLGSQKLVTGSMIPQAVYEGWSISNVSCIV